MIEDVTADLRREQKKDLRAALGALAILKEHFGRETMSAALGEISERLVARYAKATRIDRGGRGHDLVDSNARKIEVKSRLPGKWGDSRQFNFGKHTSSAHIVYCIAWDDVPSLSISHAIRITVRELKRRWGRTNGNYCARVNLRQLKGALASSKIKVRPS